MSDRFFGQSEPDGTSLSGKGIYPGVRASSRPVTPSSAYDRGLQPDRGHSARFYDSEAYFIQILTEFVVQGVRSGETALVFVTRAHREALESSLQTRDMDPADAPADPRYTFIDAEKIITQMLEDEKSQDDVFVAHIAAPVERAVRAGSPVRICSELVALLWEQGNWMGTLHMEGLWNRLQERYPFQLLCAYPMKHFNLSSHGLPFARICRMHAQVLPDETADHGSVEERQRALVVLQQQSRSLEAEIVRRKQAEKALRLSEVRYRRLFEAAKEGVLILDEQTLRIIDCNPYVADLLDRSPGDILGQTLTDVGLLDESVGKTAFYQLRRQRVIRYDLKLVKSPGQEREIEVVANLYQEDGRPVIQCSVRDITERKRLELEKDDFLSIVSHELKTPITSLKAYTQVLATRFRKEQQTGALEHLGKMEAQINRLASLIGALLDISEIKTGELTYAREIFRIDELVSEIAASFGRTSARHKLIRKGKTAHPVRGDRTRLAQVIEQLLSNAIKYSPQAERVELLLSDDGNQVRLEVRDFGMGIRPEDQPYVFERFYRECGALHETYPGLGLGLYLAAEIIRQHGGTISVRSEKGRGSSFTVFLPIYRGTTRE